MVVPRVLVADDETNLCKVLAARLRQDGLQCVVAHDGVQALEIVRSQPIEVAVIDIRLPRKNGVQVLTEIRRDYPHLPCILITAFDDTALHEEAVRQGAKAVLQKPFDLDTFTDLVWREIRMLSANVQGAQALLSNGEKVMVYIRRGEWSYSYTPRVLSQDDTTIEVEPPMRGVDDVALSQGVAIVQFARGDGMYQFRSRVKLETVPRPTLVLRKPVSIRRLQRRKYSRAAEKGQVSLAFSPWHERQEAPLTLTGELYDLSLGGFSCLLPRVPPLGEETSFQITSPRANLTLIGQARVVHVGQMIADRVPAAYRVGLEFIRLSPSMRRALAEWLEQLHKQA